MVVTTVLEATGEGVGECNAPNYTSRLYREATDDIRSIVRVIKHVMHSDDITFDAALHAVRVDLFKDSTKWEHVFAMAASFALVPIMGLVVKEMVSWNFKESAAEQGIYLIHYRDT
jgi:hypothetical protein